MDRISPGSDESELGEPPIATTTQDLVEQLKDQTTTAIHQAVEVVRKHPVEAAAVVIGTGLLVWWLFSRRQSAARHA